ncbi:MAG: hypothetical protein M3Y27_26630, partial [Acidobacteriota bacterium]|nr:hypothetical protein [Acidobacteriota bacterium]
MGLALAQPQNLSVTPNAEKGLIRTFTFTLYHPNGAASISWAEIDLGPALASGSSCFFIIQPPYNDIVLMSNNSGTWNAPITPGSSATTSNSQCTITASGASITLSGNYLYVNVPVSFAPAYGPNATIWAISLDTSGQYSGGGSWSTLGSWTVGNPLHSVQVNPSSGSSAIGQQQIFTFTVSDDNGRGEIGAVQGIVGPQSSLNSCLFQVSPSGLVWLLSDQAVWMGPVTAGSAQTLQNSQCTISAQTLSVAQSSIVANGYDVRVPVTFNGYNGTVPIWLLTYDSFGGYAGWTQVGTRAVGSAPSFTLSAPPAQTLTAGQARNVQETIIPQNNFNSAVTFNWTNQGSWPAGLTASFSPSSATTSTMITISTMSTTPASTYTLMFSGTGGGITQTQSATVTVANAPPRPWSLGMTSNSGNSAIFNFTYQDDTGSLSITKAYFAVQNGALPPAPNACYGYYDQVANAFALLGDDGQWKISSWQMDGNRRYGGYDTQALVNSQCVLRAQASYVQRSGSLSGGAGYLTVNIQLDFRTAFGGSKNVYFSAVDYAGNNSGWVQPGNGLFSVQSTQFNSPATEQAIFSFLPFDHYDNTPASAIPLKSCPPGTTVRGCIQTALQNYSTQNVTGMKIAFGLCGGTFSTAISNCGGSNPQPNQAWLTNVGAFFADMRAYGQMTNVALCPIFNGIGDNGIQTNAQISDQFCTGQNKSVWLEPATPYPFDIGSDGGKGPPFTGGAARETYTCAPANPIFVGWPNIFS